MIILSRRNILVSTLQASTPHYSSRRTQSHPHRHLSAYEIALGYAIAFALICVTALAVIVPTALTNGFDQPAHVQISDVQIGHGKATPRNGGQSDHAPAGTSQLS